jgi:HlyD family secretion protein
MTIAAPSIARGRASSLARIPQRLTRLVRWLLVPMVAIAAIWAVRAFVPIRVLTHRVDRGPVNVEAFGRGTVESERQADLGFDMVGRVSAVLVDEGDRVKQGQDLARLAPEQFEADLKTAVSSVGAARSALRQLAAEEQRAKVALDAAQREATRAQTLAPNGLISQRDLDTANDQVRLARADYERIAGQRAEALSGVDVALGGAGQSRATMRRSTLVAPFDGLITRRVRDPGNTVNVGSTVLRIVDTEHLYVRAWIDESLAAAVKDGQEAEVSFPGGNGSVAAAVIRVGGESDRQTHELLVDLRPKALERRVSIGQRVDVWIRTARHDAVTRIPPAFVRHEGDMNLCVVDRGGKTAVVPIKLGAVGREYIEVDEGLQEGDIALRAAEPAGALPAGRRWKGAQ